MTTTTSTPPPGSPATPVTARDPRSPRSRRSVAAWCADRRWRTLLAAVTVLAGCALLLSGGMKMTDGSDGLVGDSAEAERIAEAADFGDVPTESIVVSRRSGTFTPEQAQALGPQLRAAYTGVRGVAEVGEPALSADRTTTMLPIALAAGQDDEEAINTAVGPVLDTTRRLAGTYPELRIGQVGPGSVSLEVDKQMDADFRRAELFSLPVTLAVLLIAFGAVVAAGVPLLLGIGSVVAAMGITALISRQVQPVDDAAQSLLLLIGLAVGVDYALFVLRRSREERAAGASPREAVVRAGATAGRAVVISGITVVVAMCGMLVAGGLFTSLAIGAVVVVAVSIVASVTVLPAVLSILGDRVEKLRLPIIGRRRTKVDVNHSGWGRLAGQVTRRPLIWTVAAGGLLLTLAAPALGMHTSLPGDESLPKSMAVVEAYDRLKTAFPQEGSTVDMVVRAPAAQESRVREALEDAFGAARATGEIAGTEPDISTSTDRTVTVMHLAVPHDRSSPETGRAVDAVRNDVQPAVAAAIEGIPGAEVHVGGAAVTTDLTRWTTDRLPWVVGFVLVLTFIVMLVSFGSPSLAAATVGLNLLSVGAAYGMITLVFQNTWAEGLLGFTSIGSITAWLPLLMFVILFGLSMDYHVFVVSRVREAWRAGASPRDAVRLGVARSAGVVTSAAAVMVAVFAIFGTLSSLEMKQLGVGLATAILLDATLVRGVLLPGVLALLGRRAHTGPRWIPALHG